MDREEKASCWLAFASSAIAGFGPGIAIDYDDEENVEQAVEDVSSLSCAIADVMIYAYEKRFGKKSRKDDS